MNWRISPHVDLAGKGRIEGAASSRQMATAKEILRRFDRQPGVILADEVGMGKTYVALAVAASVVEATDLRRPVVVMVPASVQRKWPKEWHVFRQECLHNDRIRATDASILRGSEFLKLLDDPPRRRKHIIFMTHEALTRSLSDPFIQLAIVRQAMLHRSAFSRQRKALPQWSWSLFSGSTMNARLAHELLGAPPARWGAIVRRDPRDIFDDDPIPDAVLRILPKLELDPLREALAHLPLRDSMYGTDRLRESRRAIASALNELWRRGLREMEIHSPLLIMDEAHHLKNPWTALAGLFGAPLGDEGGDVGSLANVFDRMLFLTATPFQLGHHELLQVLQRFEAVRWKRVGDRTDYRDKLGRLQVALDTAQGSALRLDDAWGRLSADDTLDSDEHWWTDPGLTGLTDRARIAAQQIQDVDGRMRTAETLLRPWVIRHVREDKASRRNIRPGESILDEGYADRGLSVGGQASLPFLLSARAQALVAIHGLARQKVTRAYFAEGLSSSFEAYRMTRLRKTLEGQLDDESETTPGETLDPEVRWYLDAVDQALPPSDSDAMGSHPKLAATVDRAIKLWLAGEKVVVFCFYIETGRALRRHLSTAIKDEFVRLGAEALGLPSTAKRGVLRELSLIGDRFFDGKAPLRMVAEDEIQGVLSACDLTPEDESKAVEITLRFLRTPSFLLKHMDISQEDRTAALRKAMDWPDESGLTLRDKIEAFGTLISTRVQEERDELFDALSGIQTGSTYAEGDILEAAERSENVDREEILPNVRLANGGVSRETRDRLMLAFNTPFFPEILVASSVMAEGVDLHLNCRHVIHHDLDWNPSVLEQRTGRLDRLGSKGERTKQPVIVYEPYIEATQDEKQFRVVKDRERWFQVVMGEQLRLDEAGTDRIAGRVPLPEEVAQTLSLRLGL